MSWASDRARCADGFGRGVLRFVAVVVAGARR